MSFLFTRKSNFLSLFVGIRAEIRFTLICPLISPFKLDADKFILSITEKNETSSEKSLGFI